MNEYFYKILNIQPDASPHEVKKAYHISAKKNHPDLFPEKERHTQQLKMMKINEAYMSIVSYFEDKNEDEQEDDYNQNKGFTDSNDLKNHVNNQNLPVELKDPAYAYYKLGFKFYSEGQTVFHKRFSIKEGTRTINIFLSSPKLLKLAISALSNFEKSYEYFLRVINEYPDSMWTDDAHDKLAALDKFNNVYQKICENISSKLN